VRGEFVRALVELGEADERIVLLTGDLGFMVVEPFAERFPERFFNAGVAEQNMIGLATGLADAGFVPYVYSIATFASMRPYEMLRNGPILHSLPVRLVGIGGGLDYGHNGVTHYALEDIAIMRTQPELTVAVPADAPQAAAALRAVHELEGPVYLRLEKNGPPLPQLDGRFRLGRLEVLGDGEDVALVACGSCVLEAVEAADLLEANGIHASVAVVSSFNPSPVGDLAELLARVPLAVSIEAHYPNGGLRSFVAETIAACGCDCRLVARSVEATPRGMTGTREFLFELNGLNASRIADAVTIALSVPAG
jgi:transketolase